MRRPAATPLLFGLALALLSVACWDFSAAFERCVAEGHCGSGAPDSGEDASDAGPGDSGTPDSGADGGQDAGGFDAGPPPSWRLAFMASSAPDLTGVWASSPTDVWIVGASAKVIRHDGTDWSDSFLSNNLYYAVNGTGPADVWLVGYAAGEGRSKRHDGGTWWRTDSSDTWTTEVIANETPFALWVHRDEAWTVGRNGLVARHRRDDGWAPVPGAPVGTHLAVFGFPDAGVWVAGQTGLHHWSRVDGGWSSFDAGSGYVNGLWGATPDDLWAVMSPGAILHWDGSGWTREAEGLPSLFAISGTSPNDLWAVGRDGGIFQSFGGTWRGTWTARPSPTGEDLFGVFAVAPDDVWAVGRAGVILHYSR